MSSAPENHNNDHQFLLCCGASHTVAIFGEDDNTIMLSWGQGEDGQLGHGDANERLVPEVLKDLSGGEAISIIACGSEHTIVASEKYRKVYSWGEGDFGRLGNGNNSDLFLPQTIPTFDNVPIISIVCGDNHCMAIKAGGELFSWGRNQYGQLGLGTVEDCMEPRKVETLTGQEVTDVACGAEHTVAITSAGKVFTWGWGSYGNLGLGDRKHRELPVGIAVPNSEQEKVIACACGWRHTCLVTDKGSLYTFGWAKYGQLGHLEMVDRLYAEKVIALEEHKVKMIAGGWRHTVALTDSGRLFAWGWNRFGQLGINHTNDIHVPTQVLSLATQKVTQVRCGWRHTVASTDDGAVYSWGRGANGQLGHNNTQEQIVPTRVTALDRIRQMGAAKLRESAENDRTAVQHISACERYARVPDVDADCVPDLDDTYEAQAKRQRVLEVPELRYD